MSSNHPLPDHDERVHRAAISVEDKVGRVQNHLDVVHSGVQDRSEQSHWCFLACLVHKDLTVSLAVSRDLMDGLYRGLVQRVTWSFRNVAPLVERNRNVQALGKI